MISSFFIFHLCKNGVSRCDSQLRRIQQDMMMMMMMMMMFLFVCLFNLYFDSFSRENMRGLFMMGFNNICLLYTSYNDIDFEYFHFYVSFLYLMGGDKETLL